MLVYGEVNLSGATGWCIRVVGRKISCPQYLMLVTSVTRINSRKYDLTSHSWGSVSNCRLCTVKSVFTYCAITNTAKGHSNRTRAVVKCQNRRPSLTYVTWSLHHSDNSRIR